MPSFTFPCFISFSPSFCVCLFLTFCLVFPVLRVLKSPFSSFTDFADTFFHFLFIFSTPTRSPSLVLQYIYSSLAVTRPGRSQSTWNIFLFHYKKGFCTKYRMYLRIQYACIFWIVNRAKRIQWPRVQRGGRQTVLYSGLFNPVLMLLISKLQYQSML